MIERLVAERHDHRLAPRRPARPRRSAATPTGRRAQSSQTTPRPRRARPRARISSARAPEHHHHALERGDGAGAATACSSSGRPSSAASCLIGPPKRVPAPAASTRPAITSPPAASASCAASERVAGQQLVGVRHAPRASRASAARSRGARRAGSATPGGGRCAAAAPSPPPSCSGSPRSQPSDRITTTAPRPSRRPWTRLSSASAAPIRVPPDEVGDRGRRALERPVVVAARQLVRDPREPRAERERLDPSARGDTRVQVLEQHPRVRRHRAGHVAHEHQRPRARRWAPRQWRVDRLAAGAQRGCARSRRRSGVVAAPRRPAASGASAASARAGRAARSARGRAPISVVACSRRSPCRAAARRRSTPRARGPARSIARWGASRRRRGSRRAGSAARSIAPSSLERCSCPSGARAEHGRGTPGRTARGPRGASTARRAARAARRRATGAVDRGQRAVRGQHLADADARALGAHRPRAPSLGAQPRSSDRLRHPRAPSARAHAATSSCTFSATPSVSSRSASSPSASSACAQTIVSPTPGSLYRSPCSRSRATARDDPLRRSPRARRGSARGTIARSRSGVG